MYKLFFYTIVVFLAVTSCSVSKHAVGSQDVIVVDSTMQNNLRLSNKLTNEIGLDYIILNDSSSLKYILARKLYDEHCLSNQPDSTTNVLDISIREFVFTRTCSHDENHLIINLKVSNDSSIVIDKDYKTNYSINRFTDLGHSFIADSTFFLEVKKDILSINNKLKTPLIKHIEIDTEKKTHKYTPRLLRISIGGEVSIGGVEDLILTNSFELFLGNNFSGEFGIEFNDYFNAYSGGFNIYFGCGDGFFIGGSTMVYDYSINFTNHYSEGGYQVWKIKGGYYYRLNRFFGVKANLFYGITNLQYNRNEIGFESLIPLADMNFFGANIGLSFNL